MTTTLIVTATEANRNFSKLLREVERGRKIAVTSHGRKVAVISSPDLADAEADRRAQALSALRQRWAVQPRATIGAWCREDLYERD